MIMRLPATVVTVSFLLLTGFAHAAAPAVPPAPAAPAISKSVALVELDVVTVLALSQADGRAVLALPDKQMVVVKAGDPVPRTRAVLTQVLGDKVVLDEKSADGKTMQMVWMHKGQGATPGRIERFASAAAPTVTVPPPQRAVTILKSPAASTKP